MDESVTSIVKRDSYQDSVRLMELTMRLQQVPGVETASAMMGTAANKTLFADAGLLTAEIAAAGPGDLCIAIRASDAGLPPDITEGASGAPAAARAAEAFLADEPSRDGARRVGTARSLAGGMALLPGANLALISVPGPYAAQEARRALEQDLHVLLFSDNVPIEEEMALKQEAERRGLLLMGADCGTSVIGGVALGFANRVPAGPVGIVGASGTGIQEVSSLLARLGSGITHAIGTGSRDLDVAIGGTTTRQGLRALLADPATRVVVWVSKPGDLATTHLLLGECARAATPVVAMLLGLEPLAAFQKQYPSVTFTSTLEEAACRAAELAGGAVPAWADDGEAEIARRVAALAPEQHALCGVFAGGTLAGEAAALIGPVLGGARTRQPLPRAHSAAETPAGAVLARWPHRIVDYGDDAYTHGRAHPVIDPRERQEAIRLAGEDPHIAVLLLDVILGCGTHPDPAGALASALEAALVTARARGGDLVTIAHVCGTDLDPQPYTLQCARLARAGALVARSNAQAARYAAWALALLGER